MAYIRIISIWGYWTREAARAIIAGCAISIASLFLNFMTQSKLKFLKAIDFHFLKFINFLPEQFIVPLY